jgi:hypothetical protein
MDPVGQVLGALRIAGVQLDVEEIVLLIRSILWVSPSFFRVLLRRFTERTSTASTAGSTKYTRPLYPPGNTLVRKLTPTLVRSGFCSVRSTWSG